MKFVETAIVKECNHLFCASCILNWVAFKENKAVCPTCRRPFEILCTYRSLDGTIYDKLIEENVCMLLRAEWFENKLLSASKGKNCAQRRLYGADDYLEVGEDNDHEEDYYDEEDYYLSSSPSSSRTTLRLGNRRWGANGYVTSGRMQARPSSSTPSSKGKGKGKGKAKGGTKEPQEYDYKPAYETPVKKPGRRAKRTAKREALDRSIC